MNKYLMINVIIVFVTVFLCLGIITERKNYDFKRDSITALAFGLFLIIIGCLLTLMFRGSEFLISILTLRDLYILGKTIPIGYGFILSGLILFLIHLVSKKREKRIKGDGSI